MKLSLFIAMFLVISCVAAEVSTVSDASVQQKWRVVAPGATNENLYAFLNVACGQLEDCKEIKGGGSCYQPFTLHNHASYILNLNFRKDGNCDKDIGIFADTDHSFGKCKYT